MDHAMRHLFAVQVFLSLVFLVQLQRVLSRSSRKLVLPEITRTGHDENIKVENLKTKRKESPEISDVSVKPAGRLQQGSTCYCNNFCLDPNSSELEKLMWIDNNPVFCKESGTIDIEKEPYLAGYFFFCCRRCNVEYYSCVLTRSAVQCLELAYKCAGDCVKGGVPQIVVRGW